MASRKRVCGGDFCPFAVGFEGEFATHYLFVKQHKTREICELKPSEKTAFVINVPPYFNEDCMRTLFSPYGHIDNVYFHDKPTSNVPSNEKVSSKYFPESENQRRSGYKVAFVVYKKDKSLEKLLSSDLEVVHPLSLEKSNVLLGVKKWCQEYNDTIIDAEELGNEIEEYMDAHDKKVEEEAHRAKEEGTTPDDEGWVTISRHSHKSVLPRTEAISKKLMMKEKKKRSQKALLNFYSFQIRESKMENLAQLRKKFQEDKAKIAALRASRKFRPM